MVVMEVGMMAWSWLPLSQRHMERKEEATGEDHQCIMGDGTSQEGLKVGRGRVATLASVASNG